MESSACLLTPEGIGTDAPRDNAVIGQLRKAFEPMAVTELGILISSVDLVDPRDLQSWNAASPMENNSAGARKILIADLANADFPMDRKVSGRLAVSRDEQPKNADSAMLWSFFGSVTEVSAVQPENTEVSREVTDSGRVRSV